MKYLSSTKYLIYFYDILRELDSFNGSHCLPCLHLLPNITMKISKAKNLS